MYFYVVLIIDRHPAYIIDNYKNGESLRTLNIEPPFTFPCRVCVSMPPSIADAFERANKRLLVSWRSGVVLLLFMFLRVTYELDVEPLVHSFGAFT